MEQKKQRLNVLLGMTDHLASAFAAMTKDYAKFFKGKQGAFLGELRTYTPREGTVDEPGKRKNVVLQTTVNEKIDWFKENARKYVDAIFAVEATNANGVAKAELIVEGKSWGVYSSLELLRLKSVVENSDLKNLIEAIPVRSDAVIWEDNTTDQYSGRAIVQTPMAKGVEKTTVKEHYILEDPNVAKLKDTQSYTPQVGQKNTVTELGDYTHQYFSGEWTQRKKADALRRRSSLVTAIVGALKECNEAEVIESSLTADKVFNFIFD